MKSIVLRAGLCAGLAFPVAGQDVARGKALFETRCSRCHHDGGASFRTSLAELQDFAASLAARTPPH